VSIKKETCLTCGKVVMASTIKEGNCWSCTKSFSNSRGETNEEKIKQDLPSIIVVTSDHIPTMKVVSILGLARGSTVRAKHMGRDIGASLKNIVGGEIVGYTAMMAEAREEALYRMKEDAVRLGANGVTAFRFASATIDVGSAEVTAYGTAVTVEKDGV
jgi:uncharacterized protein YbjQ (UPF0145 family)